MIKKLKNAPESSEAFLSCVWGEVEKRTFRFTKHIASFCFFGTFRFADYKFLLISKILLRFAFR